MCEAAITSHGVNITFLKAGPCKHWLNEDRELRLRHSVEFSSYLFDFLSCALFQLLMPSRHYILKPTF